MKIQLLSGEVVIAQKRAGELVGELRKRLTAELARTAANQLIIQTDGHTLSDQALVPEAVDLQGIWSYSRFLAAVAKSKETKKLAKLLTTMREGEKCTLEQWLCSFEQAGGDRKLLEVSGDRLVLSGVDTDAVQRLAKHQEKCKSAPLPAGLCLVAVANDYKNEFDEFQRMGVDHVIQIGGEVVIGGSDIVGDASFVAKGRNIVSVGSTGGVSYVDRYGTTLALEGVVVLHDFDKYQLWYFEHELPVDAAAVALQLNAALNSECFDTESTMRLLLWLVAFFAPSPTPYDGYGT